MNFEGLGRSHNDKAPEEILNLEELERVADELGGRGETGDEGYKRDVSDLDSAAATELRATIKEIRERDTTSS